MEENTGQPAGNALYACGATADARRGTNLRLVPTSYLKSDQNCHVQPMKAAYYCEASKWIGTSSVTLPL